HGCDRAGVVGAQVEGNVRLVQGARQRFFQRPGLRGMPRHGGAEEDHKLRRRIALRRMLLELAVLDLETWIAHVAAPVLNDHMPDDLRHAKDHEAPQYRGSAATLKTSSRGRA